MNLQQQYFQLQEKVKAIFDLSWMEIPKPSSLADWKQDAIDSVKQEAATTRRQILTLGDSVKTIGVPASMDDYEKRKLGIFNQLNFFQLITGIIMPMFGLLDTRHFPGWTWVVISLPAFISFTVLWLNARQKFEAATIFYFIAYPVLTSVVYMSGINVGVELFFILYGILSVFFLQQLSHMLFSIFLSMISYFMLAVLWSDHHFQLRSENMFLYLFNEIAGIVFIFYGLFLIKKENLNYQASVLAKNKEIADNAILLEQQTKALTDLNTVKNKLFSVIAHDLKTPMYSLRNLFNTIQQQKLPAKDIKAMLPDMVNNLNYTTGLMENLLQWAKSQMQSEGLQLQSIDASQLIADTIGLMQLPAAAKQIIIETNAEQAVYVQGDKDMVALVLRNLLSNAVKFTPAGGRVSIDVNEMPDGVEISVTDSGKGISQQALHKINRNEFFSTNGTAHEPGTGLGLMLCREFLLKNGSRLHIESEHGQGSTFSFSLPVV